MFAILDDTAQLCELYCEADAFSTGQVGLQFPPRQVSYHSMPLGLSARWNAPMASAMVVPPIEMLVQYAV